MTHSLHRRGTEESLKQEYIVISLITKEHKLRFVDIAERMDKLSKICIKYKPNNYWHDQAIFACVYNDKKTMSNMLKELKEADCRLSVVVGVFGNQENIPEEAILDITTMCGHHCISPALVKDLAEKIRNEQLSKGEAVIRLTKLCTCNIFNPDRARTILSSIVK